MKDISFNNCVEVINFFLNLEASASTCKVLNNLIASVQQRIKESTVNFNELQYFKHLELEDFNLYHNSIMLFNILDDFQKGKKIESLIDYLF